MQALDAEDPTRPGVVALGGEHPRDRPVHHAPAGVGPVRPPVAVLPPVAPRLPGVVRGDHPLADRRGRLGAALLGLLRPGRPTVRCRPSSACETRVVDGAGGGQPAVLPGPVAGRRSPSTTRTLSFALGQPFYVLEMQRGFGGVLPDQYDGVVELLPAQLHPRRHRRPDGFMRSPATAGRDPIFWLHHANIDRLWEVWLSLDGSIRLTDPGAVPASGRHAVASAVFWFGDEQAPTTYAMEDGRGPRAARRWTTSTSRSSCRLCSPTR